MTAGFTGNPEHFIEEDAALVWASQIPAGQVLTDDRFSIVIVGRPRWKAAALQETARTNGHAGALKQAFLENGSAFLEDLVGSFALAIADRERDRVLLAIDRMGIQTLCYASQPGSGLIFGTSADVVAGHPGLTPEVDPQALYHYLYFHVIPSPETIFTGVHKLRPAHYLEYRDGRANVQSYWRPHFQEDKKSSRSDLAEQLRSSMREAVKRSMGDDRPAAFLSGGVDSSTIAGILTEVATPPAKTYTIGFDASGYDEMRYARMTAHHFGTEAHEYYVKPRDVADALPTIIASYDEPFGNSSVVPAYYCARLAAEDGTRVLLAGDGGDELFGGNVRYVKQQIFEAYGTLPGWLRRRIIEPSLLAVPFMARVPMLNKARSYVEQALVPLPARLESYNYFCRTPAAEILDEGFAASVDLNGPLLHLGEVYQQVDADSALNRMLALDWKQTLADNDLRKVNRMGALAGVEVRYPFLDDDLVELSTRIPSNLKIRHFRVRHFFKATFRSFLPGAVLKKSKHGFGLPFGVWMRTDPELRTLVLDALTSLKGRAILSSKYIDRLVQLHSSSHAGYYGEFIWVLVALQLWLEARTPNWIRPAGDHMRRGRS